MKALNRKDFYAESGSRGFTIFYKDRPIGEGGTGARFKGRGAPKKQAVDNAFASEIEIMKLVEGTGQKRFYEQINKIEEA